MMPETLSVGTTVYIPHVTRKEVLMPCPDCKGDHKWLVIVPSGMTREIDCPRCKGGKSGYEFLRPKRYERTLEINEYVISEVSIRQMRQHNSDDVRTHISYSTAPYSGSTSPDKLFTDRDSAVVAGDAMMIADATRSETEWDKDQKRAEAIAGRRNDASLIEQKRTKTSRTMTLGYFDPNIKCSHRRVHLEASLFQATHQNLSAFGINRAHTFG